jgi:hypothetical protein
LNREPVETTTYVDVQGADVYIFDYLELMEDSIRLYEKPAHIPAVGQTLYESREEDYRLMIHTPLNLRTGDVVFSPSLGRLTIGKVEDGEIWITDIDLGRLYMGLSGELILTLDFQNVVGFISRIEQRSLVIVRSRIY